MYTKTIDTPTTAIQAAQAAAKELWARGSHNWDGMVTTPTHTVWLIESFSPEGESYAVLVHEN